VIKHRDFKGQAIFDLCSFDGKIMLSGDISEKTEETKIELNQLPKGRYQLILIEEGKVYRKCIQA